MSIPQLRRMAGNISLSFAVAPFRTFPDNSDAHSSDKKAPLTSGWTKKNRIVISMPVADLTNAGPKKSSLRW